MTIHEQLETAITLNMVQLRLWQLSQEFGRKSMVAKECEQPGYEVYFKDMHAELYLMSQVLKDITGEAALDLGSVINQVVDAEVEATLVDLRVKALA